MTDYLERSNDSLIYKIDTRSISDYGNLRVSLQNVKHFPVLVELTNSKGEVVASEYSESNSKIEFNLIEPAVFSLRAIYDDNKNKEWDTGNFLEKSQAEEVIYYSKDIDVCANWDVEQIFDLSIPYTPEPKKKAVKPKQAKSSGF
jgi:hypothetical protein